MLLLNIDVPDIAAAERFYTAAFGLRVRRRLGEDILELSGWPVAVFLLQKPPGSIGGGQDVRRYGRHWTPLHTDVVVEDLDLAVDRAVQAGAELETPACDQAFGRIAMLADPFGNGFCLLEFNAQGYEALA